MGRYYEPKRSESITAFTPQKHHKTEINYKRYKLEQKRSILSLLICLMEFITEIFE